MKNNTIMIRGLYAHCQGCLNRKHHWEKSGNILTLRCLSGVEYDANLTTLVHYMKHAPRISKEIVGKCIIRNEYLGFSDDGLQILRYHSIRKKNFP